MFYWSKMYIEGFKEGQAYNSLHKCITINIIADGFNLNDAVHSEYLLQEKEANRCARDTFFRPTGSETDKRRRERGK